jgi:hypothetical protein
MFLTAAADFFTIPISIDIFHILGNDITAKNMEAKGRGWII